MTVSQSLQAARQLIAAGWCQGASRTIQADGSAAYCLLGALGQTEAGASKAAWNAVLELLSRHGPAGHVSLMLFNDHPGTTQADVLALFDRALTEVTK